MTKYISGILLLLFIIFPNQVKDGIKVGLDNSFLVLIPSLFPYMVISQIFILTGGADVISKFLYKPINFITGLTKNGVSIYILSLFCGYPTGARLSSIYYNEGDIDKKETLKLFSMGNIPGFGFCVAFLGCVIYKNTYIGIKMYLSFILASIFLGYIMSFFIKGASFGKSENNNYNLQNAIVKAVTDSANSIILVVAFVCFFSCFISITSKFIQNENLKIIMSSFIEITVGILMLVKKFENSENLVVFFTAFSGISIIFQSLSFQKKPAINIFSFIFFRLIFGLLSSIIYYILCF